MREAKALVSQRSCAGSPEPSLLILACAVPNIVNNRTEQNNNAIKSISGRYAQETLVRISRKYLMH